MCPIEVCLVKRYQDRQHGKVVTRCGTKPKDVTSRGGLVRPKVSKHRTCKQSQDHVGHSGGSLDNLPIGTWSRLLR